MIVMLLGVVVIYDILRDGAGWTPVTMTVLWILGPVLVIRSMLHPPKDRRPRYDRRKTVTPGFALLWLALWLIPVIALVAALGRDNVFSQIAVIFSKMAVVTVSTWLMVAGALKLVRSLPMARRP